MSKAMFISLEGVEGVGKSTAMVYIQSLLAQNGIDYVVTREPGGTLLAEKIREVLLAIHEETMAPQTELLLMFASRAQNVQEVILPALQAGKWVLADRFTDASFAYQGGGREIDVATIKQLAQSVLGDLKPDLTLLLDAPVEVGFARIKGRDTQDRIETEKIDFFNRVRQQYLQLAKEDPERFFIVQADVPIEQVEHQLALAMRGIVQGVMV